MAKKIDIFQVLDHLNKKQKLYEVFSEDEMKQIQPFVLMRWMSGINNAKQIYFLNELVNTNVFTLSKHKNLLLDLLTICSTGKPQRYKWIPPTSNVKNYPCSCEVIKKTFDCSYKEAYDMIELLSDEDILIFAADLGWQTEDVTKIKKELKSRTNNIKPSV